jgi:cellulose biosynthesis protein BcsQ
VDPPRGKTKNPKLFEVDAAVEAIEMLISEGWEWVFVDTGPARIDLIEAGIAVADLVLIPTRPSAFDIEQTAICVELCENHGKAHAFVLNHAPAGAKVSKFTRSSIKFLQKNGSTVIDAPLTYQEAYMAAATVGKSAPEVERGDDAHKEIEALWAVVKKLLLVGRRTDQWHRVWPHRALRVPVRRSCGAPLANEASHRRDRRWRSLPQRPS